VEPVETFLEAVEPSLHKMERPSRKRRRPAKLENTTEGDHVSPESEMAMGEVSPAPVAAASAAAAAAADLPPPQPFEQAARAVEASAAAPISVLAAAGADISARRSIQGSRRREHPNWTDGEDEELLRVAKAYHNSWSVALVNSPMLRNAGRNAEALRSRYKLLKDRWTRQQQRRAQQLFGPGEVGPQSDDPGESLENAVEQASQLEPIDRSDMGDSQVQQGKEAALTYQFCVLAQIARLATAAPCSTCLPLSDALWGRCSCGCCSCVCCS
jgi:hypothetical protein